MQLHIYINPQNYTFYFNKPICLLNYLLTPNNINKGANHLGPLSWYIISAPTHLFHNILLLKYAI